MYAVPCNFGPDEDIVLATLLALKEEWPIPQSTYFMKYAARNAETSATPYRSPASAGKITLKIKNRIATPYPTEVASDGTIIKMEPLLEAAGIVGEDAEEEKPSSSSSSLISGEEEKPSSSSSSSGEETRTINSMLPSTPPPVSKKPKVTKN